MEQYIAIFGTLILVALIWLIYFQITNRQPRDSASMQLMLSLLQDLKKEMNETGIQGRQEMQGRLDKMIQQISNHQQSNTQHLQRQHSTSAKLIQDITGKIAELEGTNKQVLNFAEQIKSLERILQHPKQRGILGEYFLETLLANTLSPQQYKIQYRFNNGEIVDAAIFFRDTIIPIDAKFSLARYNRMIQTDDKAQKAKLERLFRNDVKQRIDETSKYVRVGEDTTAFAFMFIPAEGVYQYLLSYNAADSRDMVEYAFRKRVVIVSPTSFYAYLETILLGLKGLEIEDSVKEVIKKVSELGKHLSSYESYLEKVGKHLGTAVNMYNQAAAEFQKIDKNIYQITEQEEGGSYQPTLFDRPK